RGGCAAARHGTPPAGRRRVPRTQVCAEGDTGAGHADVHLPIHGRVPASTVSTGGWTSGSVAVTSVGPCVHLPDGPLPEQWGIHLRVADSVLRASPGLPVGGCRAHRGRTHCL